MPQSPPPSTEDSLANDYAPIAALLQQLDHQVTAFVGNTERLAHNAAPAYAGLTDRWIQEAKAINKSEGSSIPQQRLKPPPVHSKDTREEEDDDESMDSKDDPVIVV
jgi:hypothetical protein